MRLRIKNWSSFQHYKDRRPPWIKLHFKILHSRDWVAASDSDRVLAVASMLIASQDDANDGSFEADPEYFQRVAYLKRKPDFKSLIELGFLESASNCLQPLQNALSETETETETDAASKSSRGKKSARPLPDDFTLTPELTAYVAGQLPDADATQLFAKFCDQARAKDWRYANWVAAFQTYCRNAKTNSGHFSAGQYPRKTNGLHAGVVMR